MWPSMERLNSGGSSDAATLGMLKQQQDAGQSP